MVTFIFLMTSLFGFTPAEVRTEDITLSIEDIAPINELEKEIPVIVTLINNGRDILEGNVEINIIDKWRITSESNQQFKIPCKDTQKLIFKCVAGEGTYAAHYPIHATAKINNGSVEQELHTVLVVEVTQDAVRRSKTVKDILVLNAPGRIKLTQIENSQVSLYLGDKEEIIDKGVGWNGTDHVTGTSVHRTYIERGDLREAIGVHPPWRTGWGKVWLDYTIKLPDAEPIFIDFATAIRDHVQGVEPPSDGVQFQIWLSCESDNKYELVFDRFSDSKKWEQALVNISRFAGKIVKIRLLTDPGPKHDTTCDQAYWADPIIIAGIEPFEEESEQEILSRVEKSKKLAKQALDGIFEDFSWRLSDDFGFALVPGKFGAFDGALSFATNQSDLTYYGFRVEIDGKRIDDWRSGFIFGKIEMYKNTWKVPIKDGNKSYNACLRVSKKNEGILFEFALEDVNRDAGGHPRFTHISLKKMDQKLYRLYAGHGNVLQEPGKLRIDYDGFSLSTSFVGFDFKNRISIVQATNIPPDAVLNDPENNIATLEAHHDLTFTIVPSVNGAFDAAIKYRKIANLPKGHGVSKLIGKMCLDQWEEEYDESAKDIERAALYGITDSIFVKHVWQRWGYDYRLPDIYPPEGNLSDFMKMVDACKRNGILFALHDNYIDFYPDATGFSYKHIIFNEEGVPQRAWYNEGRKAQSYRWLPHAFQPWLKRNIQMIHENISPTGYFIDVFSAISPTDYYDEDGNFYTKMNLIKCWGEAFDYVHNALGKIPTISEAGHDALLGHLDSAQADHLGWVRDNPSWDWNYHALDGERIPWHDAVTHGKFILFAGGIGPRYSGNGSQEMNGYGSDDYICMTVLGGRNPMCDGPFNRSAIMTYWLIHDISADLAGQEIVKHLFVDDNIHRQIVEYSERGKVIANRDETDWNINGYVLPKYGFIAESGQEKAMIIRKDGLICAFSESPDAIFADARPPEHFGEIPIEVTILGVEHLGGKKFALLSRWNVQSQVNEQGRTFIHFTSKETQPSGEDIMFQSSFPIGPEQWQIPGIYDVRAEAELPENMPLEEYGIYFGIYQPDNRGRRLKIIGPKDNYRRINGGSVIFSADEHGNLSIEYKPAKPSEYNNRLNLERKIIDFGSIKTNGAFRFVKGKNLLIPLPDSSSFDVMLDMKALGLPDNISGIKALTEDGKSKIISFDIVQGQLK
ncbi:MAG: hypothetical protein ACUVWN_14830, partial [bacterium]